jgi:hypothetical protein
MSQREDVLFCEIAITSGLVSKDTAKKVLAFCNKQEKGSGRRPLIGAVFTKYKVLQAQDVQRIYDAVGKRTGRAVGAQRVVESKPKRRKVKARAAPPRKVDPAILWQGIGGIVVLAVVLVGMVWILTKDSGAPDKVVVIDPVYGAGERETAGGDPESERPSTQPTQPTQPTQAQELTPDGLHKVSLRIADARSLAGDDAAGALQRLVTLREDLEKRQYVPPQRLLDAIESLEEKARKQEPDALSSVETGDMPAEAGDIPAEAGDIPAEAGDTEESDAPADEPAAQSKDTGDADYDDLLREFEETDEE